MLYKYFLINFVFELKAIGNVGTKNILNESTGEKYVFNPEYKFLIKKSFQIVNVNSYSSRQPMQLLQSYIMPNYNTHWSQTLYNTLVLYRFSIMNCLFAQFGDSS